MKKSIIHIGLAKTGTTSFQRNVLKLICQDNKINHYHNSEELLQYLSQHKSNMRFNYDIKKAPDIENYFISMESLSNPRDPFYWKKCAKENFKAFGEDNHILLVLRKPFEYLNSLYLEVCIHEGYYKNYNKFFLKKNNYINEISGYKFSIEDFSYTDLINEYKKYFKKVTYVKFEEFGKFDFFYDLINIDSNKQKKYCNAFNKNVVNISYNYFSVLLTKILYYLLKSIFLLLNNFLFSFLMKYIAKIYINNLNKNEIIKKQAIEKIENKKLNFEQVFHHIIKVLRWDKFIFYISKIMPNKKYKIQLKDKEILKIIENFDNEYKKLKNYETFIKS